MSSFTRIALYGLAATFCTASPMFPIASLTDDVPVGPRAAASVVPSVAAALQAVPDRTSLMKGVQPEIVKAGKITKAQIAKLSLPKAGAAISTAGTAITLKGRHEAADEKFLDERATPPIAPAKVSSIQVFVNWDDLKVPAGGTLLSVMGPFADIQVAVGGVNLKGIAVTDSVGKLTTLGDMSAGTNVVVGKKYIFGPEELFKTFFILTNKAPSGAQIIVGLNFTTSTGGSYSATPSVPIAVNGLNNVAVGSGMLGQIRGYSMSGSKVFDALDVNFVQPFPEPNVVNVVYDGFANNLFPAGAGITTSVGADSLDNTNSTVAQSTTFTSSTTVASTSSWDNTEHGNFGRTFTAEAEIDVPFLAKGKVSTAATFELGYARTDGKSTTTTYISTQAFALTCPPKQFCVGQASIVKYKMNTPFTATYQATAANGQTFTWPVRGVYNGADSTSARFVVQQYDAAP